MLLTGETDLQAADVPRLESFQISFSANPNPPARGGSQLAFSVHSWRFLPPVCPGAVVVTGSHTHSQESGQSNAHKLSACAPVLLLGPLGGALDPLVGRCWAMVPLELHLCLYKSTPNVP